MPRTYQRIKTAIPSFCLISLTQRGFPWKYLLLRRPMGEFLLNLPFQAILLPIAICPYFSIW